MPAALRSDVSTTTTTTHTHPPRTTFGPDELVVNYHDSCMYGRDLALLEEASTWLNDACIHFALTDLQVAHDDQPSTTTTTTLFLDPSVVAFLMHQCHDDEDRTDFATGCRNFDQISRLVIPINDALTATHWAVPGAGSHWSLLVLDVVTTTTERTVAGNTTNAITAHHLDSVARSGNRKVAQSVATKVVGCMPTNNGTQTPVVVQSCPTPPQQNGHDCGVHVIAAAQAVAALSQSAIQQVTRDDLEKALAAQIAGEPSFCASLRQSLATRIRGLAASTLTTV
jgi:sentrin-specific protease 8